MRLPGCAARIGSRLAGAVVLAGAAGALALALVCVAAPARAQADEGVSEGMEELLEMLGERHEERLRNEPVYRNEHEGHEHLEKERFAEAARAYGEAIRHGSQKPVVHARHGYALVRIGKPREGLASLDRALTLASGREEWLYWIHLQKGLAHGMLGELDASLASFSTSLEAKPSVAAHVGRATAFGQRGRLDRAAADYRAAARLRPDDERLAATAALVEEMHLSGEFVERMAGLPGAERTPSGLVYIELEEGSGPQPTASDTVRVHYHGTLRDGSVFDSSVDRGAPATFPLERVIACWTEGVPRMRVGGRSKLVCPASLAYGERGGGGIPPGASLLFEMQLLAIE